MTSSSNGQKGVMSEAWKASARGISAIFVFGAFINLLKFAMPLYTLQILDRIPDSRSIETLVMLTIIALLAVVSGVSLEAIRSRMLVSWAGWVKRRFGPYLVHVGITGARDNHTQSATRSLDHLQSIRSFIENSASSVIDVIWAPLFIFVVFMIHPIFGVIMLLALALRLFLGLLQHQLTRPSRQLWSSASRDAEDLVNDAERNAESIGAHNMAHSLSHRWLENIKTKLKERERSQTHGSLFGALNKGLYRCLYIAGMGIGVWLVVQNSLTIGGVIAVNIIMRFGFRLVDRGIRRWGSFSKARKAYYRLTEQMEKASQSVTVMNITEEDLDAPLVLERVSFRYPQQPDSLMRRVDLTVNRGELLCVVGPNAHGKTTFSRLVTGLISPRAGHIRLGDIEVSRIPANMLNGVIGYMPQEARLFKGTVRDNITSMQENDIADVLEAAKLAGIHDRILKLPDTYDTEVDENTELLSAGERRCVTLARAFYNRPRLIVLDEPEANMDRASRAQLVDAISELKRRGSTIIVTSQSNRLAKIADKTFRFGKNSQRSTSTNNESNTESEDDDDASAERFNKGNPV
jgi:PrtD family type I secretion system ABC transporter